MDTLGRSQRSERMSRIKGRDTKPEMVVRRAVHRLGYRYRLHGPGLPGRPDLVFRSRRKVIFVHGCFWHRHTDCRLARLPKSRLDFWEAKLESNRRRDEVVRTVLEAQGWSVLVVWECELRDRPALDARLARFLGPRRWERLGEHEGR